MKKLLGTMALLFVLTAGHMPAIEPTDDITAIVDEFGDDPVDVSTTVQDTSRAFARTLGNHIQNIGRLNVASVATGQGYASLAGNSQSNRFWAGYDGLWSDADSRGGRAGYKYDANGFIAGFDHAFSSNLFAGVAYGYSRGDFENKAALRDDSRLTNHSFALWGTWKADSGLFATVIGGYTYSDYDLRKTYVHISNPQVTRADYHADTWSVGGTLGYEWNPIPCLTLTPSVGLYYYNSRTNDFNVKLTNGSMRGVKAKQNLVELPVDLAARYEVFRGHESSFALLANAGYAASLNNHGGKLDSFLYDDALAHSTNQRASGYSGPKSGRSAANFGGGVEYRYGHFDIGIRYNYYFRSDYDSHNLRAVLGLSF